MEQERQRAQDRPREQERRPEWLRNRDRDQDGRGADDAGRQRQSGERVRPEWADRLRQVQGR